MNQQVEDLLKTIDQKRISILNFSKEAGIPVDRIYQWKKGRGNPKSEDSEKIQEWLNKQKSPVGGLDEWENIMYLLLKEVIEKIQVLEVNSAITLAGISRIERVLTIGSTLQEGMGRAAMTEAMDLLTGEAENSIEQRRAFDRLNHLRDLTTSEKGSS